MVNRTTTIDTRNHNITKKKKRNGRNFESFYIFHNNFVAIETQSKRNRAEFGYNENFKCAYWANFTIEI